MNNFNINFQIKKKKKQDDFFNKAGTFYTGSNVRCQIERPWILKQCPGCSF